MKDEAKPGSQQGGKCMREPGIGWKVEVGHIEPCLKVKSHHRSRLDELARRLEEADQLAEKLSIKAKPLQVAASNEHSYVDCPLRTEPPAPVPGGSGTFSRKTKSNGPPPPLSQLPAGIGTNSSILMIKGGVQAGISNWSAVDLDLGLVVSSSAPHLSRSPPARPMTL
ncbi:uncharacterized protein THITE_2133123 [Thermothielavioides terrestris NRRL 8126]|uniref:Uncharacterized protein n=1 Tax=Thermothielavioides terrestris (strain ATCC 38088 / NRRL 8126) TaxID=578455 RepID=G2RG88_THETT|nr:uncharacterized protein THITE_2133123 [Thermothielavioides terrestris NRRL 8126]AEO71831.1 hypothetical protein THITE_2133123 [Thermothielavioides terrestris NRRL 8126]